MLRNSAGLVALALVSGCSLLLDSGRQPDGGGAPGGSSQPAGLRRITSDSAASRNPTIIASNAGLHLFWQDGRVGNDEIFGASLSASLEKNGGDIQISDFLGASQEPVATVGDGELWVTWQDQRAGQFEIYGARVSLEGTKQGEDIRITLNSTVASLAPCAQWTGSALMVAWSDERDENEEIYVKSATRSELGVPIRSTISSGRSQEPSLAWTGSELGLAWREDTTGNDEIYFRRVSTDGSALGAPFVISDDEVISSARSPAVVWNGSSFAVAFSDDRRGRDDIFLALVTPGSTNPTVARITGASAGRSVSPSLVWNGSGYGVAWQDDRDGNQEIYVADLDAEGQVMDTTRVTDDAASSRTPTLTWTGEYYAVAWTDDREGNEEIYTTSIVP